MEYSMYIEKTHDGWYFGKCVQIPEAFSQGKTIQELKTNVLDAIHLILSEYPEKNCEKTNLSTLTLSISNETKQIVKSSKRERMLS
jgi:predicted RNase H-like HicB family nuclease